MPYIDEKDVIFDPVESPQDYIDPGDVTVDEKMTGIPASSPMELVQKKQQLQPQYVNEIQTVSKLFGIDPALVHKVVSAESGYNPKATSPAGAQGLMQLMPGTAKDMGVSDPYSPMQSLVGGTRYLKQMRDQFGDDALALAAYNWGPANVKMLLDKGSGNVPIETKNYVDKIIGQDALKLALDAKLKQQFQKVTGMSGEVDTQPLRAGIHAVYPQGEKVVEAFQKGGVPAVAQAAADYWNPKFAEALGPGLEETLAGGGVPSAKDVWENPLYSAMMPSDLQPLLGATLIGPKSTRWKSRPQVVPGIPEGSFSSLYDKNIMLEIADDAAKFDPKKEFRNQYESWARSMNTAEDASILRHVMERDKLSLNDTVAWFEKAFQRKPKDKSVLLASLSDAKSLLADAKYIESKEPKSNAFSSSLDSMLSHQKLYDEYPAVGAMAAEFQPVGKEGIGTRGAYMNKEFFFNDTADLATALHEPQHAIQDIEGWARGGNIDIPSPEVAYSYIDKEKKKLSDARKVMEKYEKIAESMTDIEDVFKLQNSEEYQLALITAQKSEQNLRDVASGNWFPTYQNLLGEIMARDTGSRAKLTQQERTMNLLGHPLAGQGGLAPDARWSVLGTENIPIEDAIIRGVK